jgi:flavodoxin
VTPLSKPPPAGALLGRRRLLRLGLAGTAGGAVATALAACNQTSRPNRSTPGDPTTSRQTSMPREAADPRVLVAYFSRAGENYYYGDRTWLEVGNTEVVAGMIGDLVACDLHQIEALEPYPDDYDETVARNVREQNSDARPRIANPLPGIEKYDVVLLGSPVWNVRAPMIMATFTESNDFTGKTVHPFTTHAMSGLGTTERDYAQTCTGAFVGEGLAVQGEEARNAGPALAEWLRRIGLNPR